MTGTMSLTQKKCNRLMEPEESTISLGRPTIDEIFKTYGYTTTMATTMAFFDDNIAAITKNSF